MEKYRMDIPKMIMGGVFFSFCLFFVVLLISSSSANVKKVTAVITDVSFQGSSKVVTADYECDGVKFSESFEYNKSGTVGDKIRIDVAKDFPGEVKTSSDWDTGMAAARFFAVSFAVIGLTVLYFLVIRELKKAHFYNGLINADSCVYAVYIREENAYYSVNGVGYMRSVFEYTDPSGKKFVFKSLPHPPDESLYSEGSMEKIYVDIANAPDKYYVSCEHSE